MMHSLEASKISKSVSIFNKAKMKMLKDCKRWALAQRTLAGAQIELIAVKERALLAKDFAEVSKSKAGMFKKWEGRRTGSEMSTGATGASNTGATGASNTGATG